MAITLPHPVHLGGGETIYRGTYTHTAGAANETFVLGSARVSAVLISNMDSGSKLQLVDFEESISGNTNTVTVNAVNAVSDGRILVFAYAGA